MSYHDGYCPNCGEEVSVDAKVCPGCGSCDETGWSEGAKYERIGVSHDDTFDYDAFVQDEFEDQPRRRSSSLQWVLLIVSLLLIALMLKWAMRL
jgi:hypothetical protein